MGIAVQVECCTRFVVTDSMLFAISCKESHPTSFLDRVMCEPVVCCVISSLFSGHFSQMVILPGAFIPPLAYAPLARTMARKGHPSYIVRFDYNLGKPGLCRLVSTLTRKKQAFPHACGSLRL